MFPSSQSGHVTMYTWTRSGTGLGKGTSMFQRTIPGHRSSERLQGIPLPMLPMQELSRRRFACLRNQSQDFCSHAGYPREPSLPAISSANTNTVRKNRKTKLSFRLCCQMLLPCMPSKEPSWPDGEEDPEGAGSPGTSAAHLCSQLCTAICLFSRTALIWTNNTASFSGYTDHTFV